ncbi:MAG: nitroreductase family protein [Actinomycetota bacterium]|nr:nitroreductase family protein [Actinomycetota bacterium]
MELTDAVRARRMTRAFLPDPIDAAVVDDLLDLARRAPSAGNSQGWGFLVLEGADTSRYWDVTLPVERRASFPWPRLLDAPVLVVVVADPDAYVARYAEADKARTGLGTSAARWPVPYWHVDAAMAAMTLLLGATDRGLGALFFGLFEATDAVKEAFAVPAAMAPVGTIALGHPAPDQRPSGSVARGRRPRDEIVHRGRWGRGSG